MRSKTQGYDEEDFLTISGIQHFTFCRRRWALIFIECCWIDNELTIGGTLIHKRVHDPLLNEKRGSLIIARDMPVFSQILGVTGHCDVVEFHQDDNGVPLYRRTGRWLPCPVEYKRGSAQKNDSDRLQLCAQAMCLEEMLSCPPIPFSYLFYSETKQRESVTLDNELRNRVQSTLEEMHSYYTRRYTPRVKPKKECKSCSLRDVCLPKLPASVDSVHAYIENKIKEETP